MPISRLWVGLGSIGQTERIPMGAYSLRGWGNTVTSHERLKSSYTILQAYWTGGDGR